MVIGDNPEGQLEKYDENIVMDRYIKKTKEQLIADGKAEIAEFKETCYDKYHENPEEYIKGCTNPNHLEYLTGKFFEKLGWTDEEIFEQAASEYSDVDEEGNAWSTYNPLSKWDWYVLGGRWKGMLKVKEGVVAVEGEAGIFGRDPDCTGFDSAIKGDILNLDEIVPFAVVKDGEWFESGKMGWWGMVSDEQDANDWKTKVGELLNGLEDTTRISMFDCHI